MVVVAELSCARNERFGVPKLVVLRDVRGLHHHEVACTPQRLRWRGPESNHRHSPPTADFGPFDRCRRVRAYLPFGPDVSTSHHDVLWRVVVEIRMDLERDVRVQLGRLGAEASSAPKPSPLRRQYPVWTIVPLCTFVTRRVSVVETQLRRPRRIRAPSPTVLVRPPTGPLTVATRLSPQRATKVHRATEPCRVPSGRPPRWPVPLRGEQAGSPFHLGHRSIDYDGRSASTLEIRRVGRRYAVAATIMKFQPSRGPWMQGDPMFVHTQ
jgi:hypothetical protein